MYLTSINNNEFLGALLLKRAADDNKSIFIIEIRVACSFCKVVRLQIKDMTKITSALIATLSLPNIFYLLKLLLEIIFSHIK